MTMTCGVKRMFYLYGRDLSLYQEHIRMTYSNFATL
ncbi:hypothetical protein Goarm_002398 [Gossypium armourianum]|uniref:Uncharacterized protein n=1 Tax=Gossypium armourianum TaxID=34283 RepID=A0A7J9K7Z5_9ROSI|nr:hypothetical protein [Gossypium armourianum]